MVICGCNSCAVGGIDACDVFLPPPVCHKTLCNRSLSRNKRPPPSVRQKSRKRADREFELVTRLTGRRSNNKIRTITHNPAVVVTPFRGNSPGSLRLFVRPPSIIFHYIFVSRSFSSIILSPSSTFEVLIRCLWSHRFPNIY